MSVSEQFRNIGRQKLVNHPEQTIVLSPAWALNKRPTADRVSFNPDPPAEWQTNHVLIAVNNPTDQPLSGVVTTDWDPNAKVSVFVGPNSGTQVTLPITVPAAAEGRDMSIVLSTSDNPPKVLSVGTDAPEILAVFYVDLENLHCDHPRAKGDFGGDTDHIALSVSPLRWTALAQTRSTVLYGVDTGDHVVNLRIGPIGVIPTAGDGLVLAYSVVNAGHSAASAAVESFDNGLSDVTAAILNKVYPIPGLWDALNNFTKSVNAFFSGDCDGPICVDKIELDFSTLVGRTALGTYRESRPYTTQWDHGFSFTCEDAQYTVTWSVTRATRAQP